MSATQQKIINNLMAKARDAQAIVNDYNQAQIDEIVLAVAWEIIKPDNNKRLSHIAVETTGLGNVADKITKNSRKTIGLLRDLKNVTTTGIIRQDDEKGLIEIARPVGIVAAITPSTNPVATPLNKVINALKCKNAVILAPSPKGETVCAELVDLMQQALTRIGAPKNLVQKLPAPIDKSLTNELCQQVDLVVATGSQNNIKRAQQTGTPTLGVGVGNVPVIIDSDIDTESVAQKIAASKTFDNATSCSSENSLIIVKTIFKEMMAALKKQGGVLLDDKQKQQLQQFMFTNNVLNPAAIAQSGQKIAELSALDKQIAKEEVAFLMVTETGIGADYPFSSEKLSPVLTIYCADDFDHAIKLSQTILTHQGQGHSCGIHSNNQTHINQLGFVLPVCRVIVNQAHCFATGGSFDNSLPFSLSMGCGSWGKNIIDNNLNYRQFLNITKIVRPIAVNQPTLDSLFSSYWQKHNAQ